MIEQTNELAGDLLFEDFVCAETAGVSSTRAR